MATAGRKPKTTAAQRAEVRRLRDAGHSIRAIATEVFGHARLRGRVERILSRSATHDKRPPSPALVAAELERFEQLSPIEQTLFLFKRRTRLLAERDDPPSARELNALLRLALTLEAQDEVERLTERTRRPRPQPEEPDL